LVAAVVLQKAELEEARGLTQQVVVVVEVVLGVPKVESLEAEAAEGHLNVV
jgi:hypothetical protein